MVLAILGFFGGSTSTARTQVTDANVRGSSCTLKVDGMACSACAARVEREALKIAGVSKANVSQPKGTAEITYDATKVSPETIAKTLGKKTGFKTEVSQAKE